MATMSLFGFGALLLICHGSILSIAVKVTQDTRSFSSASKGGELQPGVETTVSMISKGPGFISEQWFTGPAMLPGARVRIYVDGEPEPSIDADVFMMGGVGDCLEQENTNTPWGTKYFGHLANNGGVYNKFRIPFGESVRVTLESRLQDVAPYWYIIRVVFGLQLSVNGIELPASTRLRLYRTEKRVLQPYEFLDAATVNRKSGWLYQVTLDAASTSFAFLEACFRYTVDGESIQYLSSGTEDFFLSAYYFNRGIYHTDSAGLTCFDNNRQMSAYKFFDDDPMFFTKSMKLQWRCGETQDPVNGCPNHFQPNMKSVFISLGNTTTSLYAWVYEYDL